MVGLVLGAVLGHVVGWILIPGLLPTLNSSPIVGWQVNIGSHHTLSYVLRLGYCRVRNDMLLTIYSCSLPGANPGLADVHSFLLLGRLVVALRLLLREVPLLLGILLLLIHHVIELLALL